jgi:hypothetical protein
MANKINYMMAAHPLFQEFITYYEQTWLYNPSIPIRIWSVYCRSDFAKRTNNKGMHRYGFNETNYERLDRHYRAVFGLHKVLWTFIRTLQDVSDRQQSEEHQYIYAGQVPARMHRKDLEKEQELSNLRMFFSESPQQRENAYVYLCGVAKMMRQLR